MGMCYDSDQQHGGTLPRQNRGGIPRHLRQISNMLPVTSIMQQQMQQQQQQLGDYVNDKLCPSKVNIYKGVHFPGF